MTTDQPTPKPRLWTEAGFIADEWVHAEDAGALAGENRRIILPLAAWLALDAETRRRAADRLGVLIAPGEALDPIVPYLDELPLVALAFPAFNDGRSFSKAELLRRRHGYKGTVRATGEVLIDQIPHMLRTGFDAFEVSNPTALARLESGRRGGLPLHYQPTARPAPATGSFAWRRKAG